MLIAVGVFSVVLVIIFGLYWFVVLRPEGEQARVIQGRLQTRRAAEISQTVVKADERMSSVEPIDRMLAQSRVVVDPIQRLIAKSDAPVTVGTVLLSVVMLFLVGLLVGTAWTGMFLAGFLVALLFGFAPIMWLNQRASKRLATFEEQFPEAIDLLARSLRAGHAFPTAVQMAGEEIQDPVGAEFRTLFEHQNYGMSVAEALRAFSVRVPLLDARFFVTAVITQRESGGNLAEVLDKLSSVIRERFKVKRQVRVASAHGRITGWVLGMLPPVVGIVLYLIAPDHMGLLFKDPLGMYMVIAGVTLQVIGVMAIRKIVDVEY